MTTAESMVQTNVTMRAGNSKLALKAISCKISSYSLGPDYAPSSTPSPAQNFKVSATLSTGNLKIYVKSGTSLLSPVVITITATSEVEGVDESREMQMNAQIRALTDGDITKESAVLEKDCWRALTELDAKAREAEEFRKRYPKA